MYTKILLVFAIFLIAGIGANFFLFYQEKTNNKSTRFLTSERLFVFIIEILIAVIGFGVTLAFTNANEQQLEKEKAICMLEQTIEFTDSQITREKSYLNMYKKGEIESNVLLNSDVISLDYYDNILSNEVILQNANMNTYGEIMRYLVYVEYYDETAKTEENDELIYSRLSSRCFYLKKVRDFISVCCDEMNGEITSEEALQLCKDIKYGEENDSENKDAAALAD